ncbi:hypothetical protein JKP88DRAFT_247854 [Tribonema minus]|uniref:Uncharacterized protein n=1 Tax=Tribonema minus TaxID=303371 RepID=A0A836CA99_9STRA|nr:hypothetical protein JKP88DRAFT_247854 [Tribonema minus]
MGRLLFVCVLLATVTARARHLRGDSNRRRPTDLFEHARPAISGELDALPAEGLPHRNAIVAQHRFNDVLRHHRSVLLFVPGLAGGMVVQRSYAEAGYGEQFLTWSGICPTGASKSAATDDTAVQDCLATIVLHPSGHLGCSITAQGRAYACATCSFGGPVPSSCVVVYERQTSTASEAIVRVPMVDGMASKSSEHELELGLPMAVRSRGKVEAAQARSLQGGADDGVVVDVMVLYTPRARHDAGQVRLETSIVIGVSRANHALREADSNFKFNLAGMAEMAYYEDGAVANSLGWLGRVTDGGMEQPCGLQSASGGRPVMVMLVTTDSDAW